mmetsp:Transcript_2485/g.7172  ORF Transcript_2485/g.7172 Transcript_2485/m.7172 type:complete len:254 (-) Transcript_2485:450-1211(-)
MQNVDRVEPAPATAADRVVRLASGLEESETQQVTAAPAHRGGDAVERERGPAPAKPSPVSVAHDLAFASSPPDSPRSDHGRPQPPKESHYDACWESLYTQYNQKVAMHSLAEHFCSHRHFWLLFLPLQLVVATSATLALLASATNTTANNSHIQGHLARRPAFESTPSAALPRFDVNTGPLSRHPRLRGLVPLRAGPLHGLPEQGRDASPGGRRVYENKVDPGDQPRSGYERRDDDFAARGFASKDQGPRGFQ